MYLYYQKYFAGPAQKSMSVEIAILCKEIVCPSVCPSVCLLVLTSHNETASFLVTSFCRHDDFIKPSDD